MTDADREAELAIRRLLEERFPDHAIIGEEWDDKEGKGRFAWIIDPIDGTRAFITGVPVWGTLVGLRVDGRAVAGLMAQPFTGEICMSVPGEASYYRGFDKEPLKTSKVTELAKAKMTTHLARPVRARRPARALGRYPPRRADHALRSRLLRLRADVGWPYRPRGRGGAQGCRYLPADSADRECRRRHHHLGMAAAPENGGNCVAAATPELHAAAMAVLGARRMPSHAYELFLDGDARAAAGHLYLSRQAA